MDARAGPCSASVFFLQVRTDVQTVALFPSDDDDDDDDDDVSA